MTHQCYLPENANRLKQLRMLEIRQRQGLLPQGGYHMLLALKEKLGIGNEATNCK